ARPEVYPDALSTRGEDWLTPCLPVAETDDLSVEHKDARSGRLRGEILYFPPAVPFAVRLSQLHIDLTRERRAVRGSQLDCPARGTWATLARDGGAAGAGCQARAPVASPPDRQTGAETFAPWVARGRGSEPPARARQSPPPSRTTPRRPGPPVPSSSRSSRRS